jgi:hypothetical protein
MTPTAFIMLPCRKPASQMPINKKNLLFAVLYCLPLLLPLAARAQEITVVYAATKERQGSYLVDIELNLQIDKEIINALRHGVSLDIDIDLEVRQERKWLWNKLVKEVTLRYRLQHHPLSDDYVVKNLDNTERRQFQTLDEALDYLGSVKDYTLIEKDKLSKDKNYIGFVKAELNIEELPPPLQPATYGSSQWHLESQWYEWPIK